MPSVVVALEALRFTPISVPPTVVVLEVALPVNEIEPEPDAKENVLAVIPHALAAEIAVPLIVVAPPVAVAPAFARLTPMEFPEVLVEEPEKLNPPDPVENV